MTRAETAQLLTLIAETYSQKFELSESKVEAWHSLLQDLDWPLAQAAVKRHILTSRWPPTIAEVREAAVEMSGPPRMTALEAWGVLVRAIAEYGYYRQEEALESMPEDVAQAARWMGWQELCHSTNADVIRGQFCKLYEAHAHRQAELQSLPESMRAMLQGVGERLRLPAGEEEAP